MMNQQIESQSQQERSYGLVALLDAHSEATIRSLWRGLEIEAITDSLPSIVCAQPHITLGIFSSVNSQLRAGFPDLAACHLPFGVKFSSVGAFPNRSGATVFLQPVVTQKLLTLQQSLQSLVEDAGIGLYEFYQTGNWQPHSSLGLGLTRDLAAKALEFSLGLDLPIMGQVQAIGLIEMIRQGPYVISGCELGRWALGGGEHLPTPGCPNPKVCIFRSLAKNT